MLCALQAAFNRYLALDPDASRRLAALSGKVIAVELSGLNFTFYLLPGPDGIQIRDAYQGEPDTRLRGTPLALAALGIRRGGPNMLFSGDVEISGDTELGQHFKQILDSVEIDWEEQLSQWVGDVVAHQVGNVARGARKWGAEVLSTLGQDLAEYLQEETRHLPRPAEVEAFLAAVDELRVDTDRLEAHVKRLQENLGSSVAGSNRES